MIIKPNRFVGLHAHALSMGDSIGLPEEHIDFVLQNGMDAWALTDHGHGNGLAHAYEKSLKLKKNGQKYRQIYGCEFYFVPDLDEWQILYQEHQRLSQASKKEKNTLQKLEDEKTQGSVLENEEESKNSEWFDDTNLWKRRYHLVINAKSQKGLENLFILIKKSYKDGFYRFPRIDFKMLKEHSEGLIVSTACIAGYLSQTAIKGEHLGNSFKQIQCELKNSVDKFVNILGKENFFLELQFNKLKEQHISNKHLISLSKNTGIPLIVTCDSHYPSPDKWLAREMYKKILRLQQIEKSDSDQVILPKFEDLKCELYPKNADQVWQTFQDTRQDYDFYLGEDQLICDAIERTHDIAWDLCSDVSIDTSMKLPNFSSIEKSAFEQLADLVKKALKDEGYENNREYLSRAIMELGIIKEKGFENYFLTLYKVFDKATKKTFLGCGRGSGAGSLVNFLLGITHVDPIKHGLIFERFINLERAGYPDIDTDAGDRDVLIDSSKEIFGEENVIPVSNFNTLKLKSLVKDVSKLYGVPFDEVNAVTSPLQREVEPLVKGDDIEKSYFVLRHEDCMEHSVKYRQFMEKYPDVEKGVRELFLERRSIGRHAGGVLICPDIEKYMPLIKVRGDFQTPWVEGLSSRHLEDNGFLKFDFLGLSCMQMVEDCIRRILIAKNKKKPSFDEIVDFFDENLNCRYNEINDQNVYKRVYQEGNFPAIFQFTNDGARRFCQEAQPSTIDEIAAITAIYRPGPLKNNVHLKYVEARNNPQKIKYAHPIIKEVLEPTYGFMVFQEQLMFLAQKLAGFSLGEADKLRKALLKKTHGAAKELAEQREKIRQDFIDRSVTFSGADAGVAKHLWDDIIAPFVLYGFNKSHSVAYAIDSYYNAWLFTYYPKEWLATYLQSEIMDPEALSKAISEVKQLGYDVLSADINVSQKEWAFSDDLNGFVAPLTAVKGVGKAAVKEIFENRPYSSIDDLLWDKDGKWRHSKMNKTCFASLCKIEAFSSLKELKDKSLDNHKQIHDIIVNNYDKIKRGRFGTISKKKIEKGDIENILFDLMDDVQGIEDWDRKTKISFSNEISSMVSDRLVYPGTVLSRIKSSSVPSVSSLNGSRFIKSVFTWFCVLESNKRVSTNGKVFYRVKVVDDKYNVSYLRVWGPWREGKPYTLWMADVSYDPKWGSSTSSTKIRPIITYDYKDE